MSPSMQMVNGKHGNFEWSYIFVYKIIRFYYFLMLLIVIRVELVNDKMNKNEIKINKRRVYEVLIFYRKFCKIIATKVASSNKNKCIDDGDIYHKKIHTDLADGN